MRTKKRDKFDDYSATAIASAIEEWVHSDIDRQIMRLWLLDAYTYEVIAEKVDRSDKYVAKRVAKYEHTIFKNL